AIHAHAAGSSVRRQLVVPARGGGGAAADPARAGFAIVQPLVGVAAGAGQGRAGRRGGPRPVRGFSARGDRAGGARGHRGGREAARAGGRPLDHLSAPARLSPGAPAAHRAARGRARGPVRGLRGRPVLARVPVRAGDGGGARRAAGAGGYPHDERAPARAGGSLRRGSDRHARLGRGGAAGARRARVPVAGPGRARSRVRSGRVALGAGRALRSRGDHPDPGDRRAARGRGRRRVQPRARSHGSDRGRRGEAGEGDRQPDAGRSLRAL
ncbi:MAG: Agmatinase, partial [uncultured Gemmatimonadetes bacterium]